jgi:hypothetical protein
MPEVLGLPVAGRPSRPDYRPDPSELAKARDKERWDDQLNAGEVAYSSGRST